MLLCPWGWRDSVVGHAWVKVVVHSVEPSAVHKRPWPGHCEDQCQGQVDLHPSYSPELKKCKFLKPGTSHYYLKYDSIYACCLHFSPENFILEAKATRWKLTSRMPWTMLFKASSWGVGRLNTAKCLCNKRAHKHQLIQFINSAIILNFTNRKYFIMIFNFWCPIFSDIKTVLLTIKNQCTFDFLTIRQYNDNS